MVHLDEGTLQGYLDEELTPAERAAAAEHLLACDPCRATLDALRGSQRELAAALSALDVPAPPATAPEIRAAAPARKSGRGARVGLRAAVLVLVAAAAASALVPGSPVRAWVSGLLRPDAPAPERPQPPATDPAPVETSPAEGADPAGVAVPADGEVEVAITGLRDGVIRLVRTDASVVAVSARAGSADPLFRLRPGRIEVVGGVGGEIVVEVPAGAGTLRLMVEGRRYAEVVGGELKVVVPAQREGDSVIWR